MEVNILDYTIGGVLSIECEDGKQMPVVFLSKSLNETERNYKNLEYFMKVQNLN